MVGFYSISNLIGYLIRNHVYTYVLTIYNLVVGYLMTNHLYTSILNI